MIITLSTTDTIVCARYTEVGTPFARYRNIIIGTDNKINGSNNIVFGDRWSLEEGPDLFGSSGNVLIGGGTPTTVLGNLNVFLLPMVGNQVSITFHEDSKYNIGLGTALTFGTIIKPSKRIIVVNVRYFLHLLFLIFNTSFILGI